MRWFLVAVFLCLGAWAVADEGVPAGPEGLSGVPVDWSHHHLIYSSPPTIDGLRELQREPRFWHQFYRTVLANRQPLLPPRRFAPDTSDGLWGESLPSSTASGTVGAGHYPAKFSFNGSVSCSDFVIFNTSLGGGAGTTTVVFKAMSAPSGTVVITNSKTGAVLTLTAGTTTSGTTWANNSATAATDATAFNTALNTNGSSVGVYSTVASGTVTITASQLGAVTITVKNNTVANITTPASGATETISGTSAARLVGYKNLYTGTCTGVPTLAWEYETTGIVQTSVSLSSDGTQLAFIQTYSTSSTATNAQLVLLKMGTSATLAVPTIVTAAAYRSCTAPCMTTFAMKANDTNSSPFIDYTGDIAYVGDSSGNLYKFTGVFKGTPAEVTTSPWPVAVSAKILTSAVYDAGTSHIFVADSGGFLYAYNTSGTLIGKSSQLAATAGKGIVDAPVVDSTNHTAYVFVGQDGNTAASDKCASTAGCNGVFRFTTTTFTTTGTGTCASTNGTSWTSGTNCGAESVFGVGSATTIVYAGSFDNAYYSGTGTTGNLWTCAATGTPAPKLVYSPMSSFSSVVSAATNAINPLASAAASCSPVTEILNGSTDWIFLSVTASGNQTVCKGTTTAGACLYSFSVGGAAPTTASAGRSVSGGASGIIIDNTGTGGGSQTYFTYLLGATSSIKCPAPANTTAGGCAVQASQAALN